MEISCILLDNMQNTSLRSFSRVPSNFKRDISLYENNALKYVCGFRFSVFDIQNEI